MSEVLCLGIIVADLVAKPINSYPRQGELVLADDIQLHLGGCAASSAVALSKLGYKTRVCGMVGQDGLGSILIDNLKKYGVDTSFISRTSKAGTSTSMVLVDPSGERSFIHSIGANGIFSAEHFEKESLDGIKIMHVAGSLLMPAFDGEPCAEILSLARSQGITTTLDTAWDDSGRWMKAIAPCLPYLDVFIPSLAEAKMLAGRDEPGEIAQVFLDKGVKVVVIKLGGDGCYIRSRGTEYTIPAYKVNALDATGAGDCFVAGFLAGMLQGLSMPECGRLANAVGAMSVTAVGAVTGVKSLEETLEFIKKHHGQEGHNWQQ
ncbi:MAG: carbohydrate kinase family protein [Desulfotomaculum sp.]|nr:carbohydrate kinase family protein [Desulfotomaculum sp.]